MQNFLVISAIAPNRPGIANEITSLVNYCGCNILESKMKSMGSTFSLVLMASGEWNSLAKLEHVLPSKAAAMGMTTMIQRTDVESQKQLGLPYRVKFFTQDNPGIANDITAYFAEKNINIEQMSCDTFLAQKTNAPIAEIKLTISVPLDVNISNLRRSFDDFCLTTNLDASFEPITT
jgi:glycine cleavage system transcriptional repressor